MYLSAICLADVAICSMPIIFSFLTDNVLFSLLKYIIHTLVSVTYNMSGRVLLAYTNSSQVREL